MAKTKSARAEKSFPALAVEIRVLFSILIKHARRDLEKQLAKTAAGISPLGFGVLHFLAHEDMTLKELSDRMALAPATLVPVADSLEKRGYLERQADKEDRRRNLLILTPAGRKVAVIIAQKGNFLAATLSKLGPEKSAKLCGLLRELVGVIAGPEKVGAILDKVGPHHSRLAL